jgi:hypothetical protein
MKINSSCLEPHGELWVTEPSTIHRSLYLPVSISFQILHVARSTYPTFLHIYLRYWLYFRALRRTLRTLLVWKWSFPAALLKQRQSFSTVAKKCWQNKCCRREVFVSEFEIQVWAFSVSIFQTKPKFIFFYKTSSRHLDPSVNRENPWSWITCHIFSTLSS